MRSAGGVQRGTCPPLEPGGYVRYVDDLLLFGNDKAALRGAKQRMEERLAVLRLSVHRGTHPRPVAEGYRFWDSSSIPVGES